MRTATKIRWFLLMLTIGFFGIALTSRWISTNKVGIETYAKSLNSTLNEKEQYILSLINNSKIVKQLETIEHSPKLTERWIKKLNANSITLHIYKNRQLVFWSTNLISSSYYDKIPIGSSFLETGNGYYQVIKKKFNNSTIVAYILIKSHYAFENSFLENSFNEALFEVKEFEIANSQDSSLTKHIKSVNGKYLFSIKEKNVSQPYTNLEIIFWFLGFCTFVLLVNSVFKYYADLGYPLLSSVGLGTFLYSIRFVCLKFKIPTALYHTEFFSPTLFGMNDYFPSLADFGLNIIVSLWVLIFVYSYRNKIFLFITNKWIGYISLLFLGFIIYKSSLILVDIFWGLVNNSQINFDVSNVLNLNLYSLISILLLIFSLIFYFLLINLTVNLSTKIIAKIKEKLLFIGILIVSYTGLYIYENGFSFYTILLFLLFLVIISVNYDKRKILFPSVALIALIFATIISLKLTHYNTQKEREIRKLLALKLNNTEDPQAIYALKNIENRISNDTSKTNFYSLNDDSLNSTVLNFRKKYLKGYLNKFDYDIVVYDSSGVEFNGDTTNNINKFLASNLKSIKVSKHFYRNDTELGKQTYYALYPITSSNKINGQLLIVLTKQFIDDNASFAAVVKNREIKNFQNFDSYSYALYNSNVLNQQSGEYVYDLKNKDFNKHHRFKFTMVKKNGFSHLIYNATPNKVIIVSKESRSFWIELASLSFFFILFLIISGLIIWLQWVWNIISNYDFKKLNIHFFFNTNKWLYRTRIQIALVLAVVCALAIIGLITFSYITLQYKDQQSDLLRYRVNIVSRIFQENYIKTSEVNNLNELKAVFPSFSKMYTVDLNFYDDKGNLVFSDQPKIYSNSIISKNIDPLAFSKLHHSKKSLVINNEYIGKLKITSAYVPLLNRNNKVVGYLQIPEMFNPKDYNQKIGSFLNLLINIYVLVFTAIGFFAFVVATQITNPLNLIQQSLSKTKIGNSNKPIPWMRDDEIGKLIKEYNIMLIALEESAEKLAQSERQTAWREMAKQVAHEIKNPLTPLRLGIQMIQRSWKEKDPNFETKFEKFNNSFLEQIDNLSTIASDFSNFAKIPDAVIKDINLGDTIQSALQSFNVSSAFEIEFDINQSKKIHVLADENQLKVIFKSIIKNAIEAIPNNVKGLIKINSKIENDFAIISISDNGVGISEDLRDKIFSPNFNANSSGSGLGLAFAKNSLQNMHGNIHYQTTKLVGTTFFIRLPLSN